MAIRRLGFWLAAGGALAGCSSASSGSQAGASDGGMSDAGAVKVAPGSDGGKVSSTDGGGTRSDAGGGADAGTFALESVTVRNSGRHGDVLLFNVQGSDSTGQTTEVHARVLDASNNPVIAFDTNWDGVPDSAETRLHFDSSTLGQKTFTQTITLPGVFAAAPTIASAVVSLSNALGVLSASQTATLTVQGVESQGGKCDTTDVTNRCADGLSCAGTPATCNASVAPALTQVAYYGGTTTQTAELFIGSDPDEDLQSILVNFFDGNGNSIKVDLSGDGTAPPVSSDLVDARTALGQTFFFQNNPTPTFPSLVPRISATPIDSFGRSGTPVVANLGAPVIRASGLSCDAYGITGCAVGAACSPGLIGTTNTCTAVTTLQKNKCATASAAATTGVLAGWGVTKGVSLWDPPAGCSLPTEVGRPEAVVMLTLAKAVDTLTISTAVPETNFDTILYVLPSCASTPAQALGCADDSPGQGVASTVTLNDVAAGTYAVVIDSGNPQGGQFGLSVTMQ
jgi:hypothetical protein